LANAAKLNRRDLTAPWRVVDQHLEISKQPNESHFVVTTEPGVRFPVQSTAASASRAAAK
jgi:hypothetical protein